MKASVAVGLLLTSSMSVFGIYAAHRPVGIEPVGIEPVWVDGEMGVYSPSTGGFVPRDSATFAQTCDEIRRRRSAAYPASQPIASHGGSTYYHSYNSYGSHYDESSHFESSHAGSSHSVGSVRGGIGATGHAFSGGHS